MKKRKNTSVFLHKICYTMVIILIYILGRRVTLFGVDSYKSISVDNIEQIFTMTISGDVYKTSIFALGISPYMLASILVMISVTFYQAVKKSKLSFKKTNYILNVLALIFAIYQSISLVTNTPIIYKNMPLVKVVIALELIAGAMLIIWLSEQNKKYGIGGQSALILVNVIESIFVMIYNSSDNDILIFAICAVLSMFVTLVMENSEFRIPVQRISIYNVYKDKNYIAIKLNPVGVLPVMFSIAIFTFIQLILISLKYILRDIITLSYICEIFKLQHPVGVFAYIFIVYLLTVVFSIITLQPSEIAEQLLKNNDSICNISSSKYMKKYLFKVVLILALVSATVMSFCVAIPLVLQFYIDINTSFIMFPSMIMMLTGVCVNLYRDMQMFISYDSYKVFL